MMKNMKFLRKSMLKKGRMGNRMQVNNLKALIGHFANLSLILKYYHKTHMNFSSINIGTEIDLKCSGLECLSCADYKREVRQNDRKS